MEEKRRDAGTLPPEISPAGATTTKPTDTATPEPPSTRRRAGGQKRKANNGNNTGSNSTPSKRLAREKASIALAPVHNGPCTRAAAASASAAPVAEQVVPPETSGGEAMAIGEEAKARCEDWQALEAAIEVDYEAIRSRDANAHVVPNHCGWFSWTKIHPLEEQTMPSFFSGKSEHRTPDVYLEIRNWIMKKYHANPSTQVELKDLSELTVGDLDARQEVMEFLDHWGLINFHPFPSTESATVDADSDGKVKTDPLVEDLYRFETVQSHLPVVPKTSIAAPAVPSGLFPESSIAEELVRLEEPAVDYHCNSCSADCSRKRYHCQTQADYDLCSECFSNGKFGSDMSSSDFILMESAEVPGLSGGNWTDQETLLLLEALELYKENWNEIAEHVATKTKAQCILHFVQMPIEDIFLDSTDEIDTGLPEKLDPALINSDSSLPRDASVTTEAKIDGNKDQPMTSPMETSKSEDAGKITVCQEIAENRAVKALREAFEAAGSLPTSGGPLTFSEAGNPVMALAAFLARLVEANTITASARSSMKSISGNSPGMQLAARHCFFLEDPPDKEPVQYESAVAEMVEQNTQNDEKQQDENKKEEKSITVLNGVDSINNGNSKKNDDSVEDVEKSHLVSLKDECSEKSDAIKQPAVVVTNEEVRPSDLNDSGQSNLPEDSLPKTDLPTDQQSSIESPKDHPPSTEVAKDQPPAIELPKDLTPAAELPKDHPPSVVKESDDLTTKEVPVASSVKESGNEVLVGEHSQPTEAPKDVDMVSNSLPAEKNEQELPVMSKSDVDVEPNKGNDQRSNSNKEARSTDNTKRAAITALSAAAVKAKLLAKQEEDQIRQLAALLIEKQLHKLEMKLAFFNEMESVVMRVREQLERTRQKLFQERAQIITARLGLPASSSRPMASSLPNNRIPMSFANSLQRPPMSMTSQRPPISRHMMSMGPPSSNPFVSTTVSGSSIRPSNQDKVSSVGMK